ncbi:UpxZ family transcription anti-terminator antagonist [Bacteroides fragilis]|uniref:UpxZ family transcription anti-terminator antagonist n=1 Tax=Bacteroides fragilis TaxID=817 RepID=UPI001C390FA1|nr:UpxZ family transcription anti-terminator antagonist [Bacteroides fragilis]MBV4189466.1 UpxZ family transcription anti-terminator antagonist [Bacteroides fragilis]
MKNSLCNSVSSVVKKLLEYGEDGTPVYVNELTALNQELRNLCANLLLQKGESPEEEAEILVTLFKGYDTMLFNFSSENEQVIQELLDRSMTVLEKLPASVLKCQLLLECFEQTGDEELIASLKCVLDIITINYLKY